MNRKTKLSVVILAGTVLAAAGLFEAASARMGGGMGGAGGWGGTMMGTQTAPGGFHMGGSQTPGGSWGMPHMSGDGTPAAAMPHMGADGAGYGPHMGTDSAGAPHMGADGTPSTDMPHGYSNRTQTELPATP